MYLFLCIFVATMIGHLLTVTTYDSTIISILTFGIFAGTLWRIVYLLGDIRNCLVKKIEKLDENQEKEKEPETEKNITV